MVENFDINTSYPNLKIREFIPSEKQFQSYNDTQIWEINGAHEFPDDIQTAINELKPLLIQFIQGGYSPEFAAKHMEDFKEFRNLALGLAKFGNIFDALINSKYYIKSRRFGRHLGLIIAKTLLFYEHSKNGIIPFIPSRIKKYKYSRKIYNTIIIGDCMVCSSWGNILEEIYGSEWDLLADFLQKYPFNILLTHFPYLETPPVKEEDDEYLGCWDLFLKYNSAETVRSLYYLIQMGFYKNDGIHSWYEFVLFMIEHPLINNFKVIFSCYDWNEEINAIFWKISLPFGMRMYYQSKHGLDQVLHDLYSFSIHFSRSPTQFDFPFILTILQKKYWEKFGIYSWEQLIERSQKLTPFDLPE